MAESQQHRLDWETTQDATELNERLQEFFARADEMFHTLFIQAEEADTDPLTTSQVAARVFLRV